MKEKAKLDEPKVECNIPKDAKGVPEFWLTIFKNVEMLQEMVQEHDMPALVALEDITVTFSEKPMVRYEMRNVNRYYNWYLPVTNLIYTSGLFPALSLWAERVLHRLRADKEL